MHRIVRRDQLSADVYLMRIEAPLVAQERRPGQFVILQLDNEYGERIPLTIADADAADGTITIIFQAVGKTTRLLAGLAEGACVPSVLGPLGKPTHIEKFGTVVCVGGGIGVAPLHPIAKGMKEAGNRLIVIMGARRRDLLILEEPMRAMADEFIVVTDDGSQGRKGLVTDPLKEVCARDPKPDLAVAIGPPIMMKFCAEATRPFGVPTVVSLNTVMVDGTGMCGGCRVTVGNRVEFTCVDGPEFDGHLVDFDNLMTRLKAYKHHEDKARHTCNLDSQVRRLEERAQ